MTAPYLNPAILKERGLTIEGEPVNAQMPEVTRSLNGLLTKPQSTYMGRTLESGESCRPESELMKGIIGYLRFNGYRLRTPEDILRDGPCEGWIIHLPGKRAKGNPILLDLLILGVGWYAEIELKTEEGKPTKEQAALIARGGYLCRSLDEVKAAIKQAREFKSGLECET